MRRLGCSILGSILLVSSLIYAAFTFSGRGADSDEVDHLKIAITWAPGACRSYRLTCKSDYHRGFTIHGLWPESRDRSPHDCYTTKNYEAEELSHLKGDLRKYWPSLTYHSDESFWQYEWTKHGTCVTNIPGISNTAEYFQFTITQFKRFDMRAELGRYNIHPSVDANYDGSKIQRAISAMHGATVNIRCSSPGNDQRIQYLTQVDLCYSRQLQPMDCPRESQRRCLQDIMFIS